MAWRVNYDFLKIKSVAAELILMDNFVFVSPVLLLREVWSFVKNKQQTKMLSFAERNSFSSCTNEVCNIQGAPGVHDGQSPRFK